MKYFNPFSSTPQAPVFSTGTTVKKSSCGRGAIAKNSAGEYDYLIGGRLVTQRAGKSCDVLARLVGVVLGGEPPETFLEQRAIEVYGRDHMEPPR